MLKLLPFLAFASGLALITWYAPWQVTLGVFLVVWGFVWKQEIEQQRLWSNIERRTRTLFDGNE